MSEPVLDPNAIAIVGMAGRFPGAADPRALWKNLVDGVESIEELGDDALAAAGVPAELRDSPNYVKACAFLEDPDKFDAAFFGITPREAALLDPQQRVFLEVAWAALEDAGYDPARMPEGCGRVGVFAGAGKNHYFVHNLSRNPRVLETMGPVATTIASEKDFIATRVSYKFDLDGPSVSVQTACSTSLVAVHLACQSLLSFESDVALAGGSSISSFQRTGYVFIDGGIFSPDGHLRAFDASAGGQVGGNGSGAVVLKRLAQAVEDGDTIHAVIKGSAINNDGREKVSFNAPGVEGQARVVAEALEVAGVEPDSVGYVECHGTGTNLGDPIEVTALTQAFRTGESATDRTGYCAIGSLKTNVGHLDAAAGVAGLLKATLAVEHGVIPANLHFEQPNPELALETSPFYVADSLTPWSSTGPRRAGVSSFGMGGTNAHAILEEAPTLTPRDGGDERRLLVVSARSESAVDTACDRLADRLEEDESIDLADAAYTLQVGRRAFAHRRAFSVRGTEDAVAALRERRGSSGSVAPAELERGRPVAFLFSGQGSQYAGMARGLYERIGVFRNELDRVCKLLEPEVGVDLRGWILAQDGLDQANAELARTQYTQPALFAVEYALARLLLD